MNKKLALVLALLLCQFIIWSPRPARAIGPCPDGILVAFWKRLLPQEEAGVIDGYYREQQTRTMVRLPKAVTAKPAPVAAPRWQPTLSP